MTLFAHDGREVVSAADASVPLLDHGFLFGDSVYEVVRTANRRPFLLAEHLARLRDSAAMLYFDLPWSDAEITERIAAVQERVPGECYLRIIATRGPGPVSLLPDGCDRPGLYVLGAPLRLPPERLYRDGCRVAVVERRRNDRRALDPRAKTGNYLNNMLGLIEAKRRSCEDALFLNAAGELTEATTSNLWIVEGGRAITPPLEAGILSGITRGWLLRALSGSAEDTIDLGRLLAADEVFLTGTVKGVLPVTRVGDRVVGDGRPGPVAGRAAALYEQALRAN